MAINKKNFKRVLKIVEASKGKNRFFDYRVWFNVLKPHKTLADIVKHPCGTAGCIGGWATILAGYDKNKNRRVAGYDNTSSTVAERFLGINRTEANHLFMGYWHDLELSAPRVSIIAKLKNVIKTGQVINREFDQKYRASPYREDWV